MKPIRFAALPLLVFLLAACARVPSPGTDTLPGQPPASSAALPAAQTEPAPLPHTETPSMTFGMTQAEIDSQFAPLLEGLFNGESEEVKKEENIGRSFSLRSPDFVFADGQLLAYYTVTAAKSGYEGIGFAATADGVKFTDRGCVILPDSDCDKNGASSPSVWFDGDGFTLVYECRNGNGKEQLAFAVSDDGISWKKEGLLLSPDPALPWQKAGIGAPDLYREGEAWYLLFRGYDHTLTQTGLASGTGLRALTVEHMPVLPCVPDTARSGTAGRGDLLRAGDWYYRVFEASTAQTERGYAGSVWTHLFARSRDLMHWEVSPAVPLSSGHAGYGLDCPCFLGIQGHLYVYFRAGGCMARAEIVRKQA